jgi:prephenate dehydrogenase
MSETLGILGTGLIGASIGLRARSNGTRVFGSDDDPEALKAALDRGAIDAAVATAELMIGCDTLVLAVPPRATIAYLIGLRAVSPHANLIVDVASVKTPILAATSGLRNFVATHPLAGGEGRGPNAADAALFEGRPWAYIPTGDASLDTRARAFIDAMGAKAFAIAADAHDRVVARTSHLPQLLGFLIAARIDDIEASLRDGLSGPVARELLRIGASDRRLWQDILHENRVHVAREAREVAAELLEAAAALDRDEDGF